MVNRSRAIALVLAGMAIAASATVATPAPNTPYAMPTGSVTSQPIGHYDFCRAHRDECSIRSQPSAPPTITDHGWDIVRNVNASVNSTITPMTDMEIYGREEVWAYPVDAGDCEDFVLLKRKMLIEAGFPVSALLITVVRKPDGEGHAVLTLRSSDGDFVLDNLSDDVKPWFRTPYSFLKRQATFDTGRWVTIDDGRDVLVGALR
ncbi:transglutaminase-like cysteine peptidase [Agrobacterium sp. ES01]|uniref:transglutaminase-like cysteine peptidase n=1 Tax=Agrobacterium sp. ES01 TaxID=3420714 RepID=UPI003D137D5B